MSNELTEFSLPVDAYAAFDALSLKDLIVNRLTEQNVFTDQIFEGSNMSSIIDIIAYSYHVLLFYLNRTSSESLFSESEVYENINRIVKLLNYKPIGFQTANLNFKATGSAELSIGTYTIPRYTFVNAGGIAYSLNRDVSFSKNNTGIEVITSIGNENLLYQGKYEQYPIYTSAGEEFEEIIVSAGDKNIDYFNMDVYVKNVETGRWSQYKEATSLFLHGPSDTVFEKRFNENEKIEIKFGNNTTGRQLREGDQVAIYYLTSDGDAGALGPNAIDEFPFTLYTPTQFLTIREDVRPSNLTYMTFTDLQKISISNDSESAYANPKESVSEIKKKAPIYFAGQNKLVTANDFDVFVERHFSNIISSVKTVNNETYLNGHLKYLHDDLQLTKPNVESRVLYNQINFASSTNFNNIYIYAVPKINVKSSTNVAVNFLTTSQKNTIITDIETNKMMSMNPVIIDPVYVAVDFAVANSAEKITTALKDTTKLYITQSAQTTTNKDSIKDQASAIIKKYFNIANNSLGQLVDLSGITTELLSIDGVEGIYTQRTDNPAIKVDGLSVLVWNPVYSTKDVQITGQNLQLPYFKYPYLFNESELLSRIEVVTV